jgi:hypothetical protein
LNIILRFTRALFQYLATGQTADCPIPSEFGLQKRSFASHVVHSWRYLRPPDHCLWQSNPHRFRIDSEERASDASQLISDVWQTLNLLVGPDHRVKVADFGLSKVGGGGGGGGAGRGWVGVGRRFGKGVSERGLGLSVTIGHRGYRHHLHGIVAAAMTAAMTNVFTSDDDIRGNHVNDVRNGDSNQ